MERERERANLLAEHRRVIKLREMHFEKKLIYLQPRKGRTNVNNKAPLKLDQGKGEQTKTWIPQKS